MLWYNKFLILFVVLISTISCSNNTKLITSNKVEYFNVYILLEFRPQILRFFPVIYFEPAPSYYNLFP